MSDEVVDDRVMGTGVAEGRQFLTSIKEVDPELQKIVDGYNESICKAYKLLENTVLHSVMPVAKMTLIHVSQVQANDYNPNSVAGQEMKLLHTSIASDGYTQPIVAIYDPEVEKYIIVDGFHRYTTMRRFQDLQESTSAYLPVVVLEKSIADRIASTVRHNRARGKHSVQGMGNLVFQMLEAGEDDATICNKLGLEVEELARLKHVTGYSKLYADRSYSNMAMTDSQIKAKAEFKKENPDASVPYF